MGTLWSQELVSLTSWFPATQRPPEEGQPTEQNRWRAMARRLLTTVLLLGLFLGSSVLLFYLFQGCTPYPCETPVCRRLLRRYLASRDTSADPCTDFFSFACGKAKGTSNSLQALRRMLEASGSWHPGSGEEKALQFYNSCMDTSAIEAAGAGPLRQVIEELGGWRISGNWTSLEFNRTLRLLMSEYGHFPFFRAYLGPHPTSPHKPVIQEVSTDILAKSRGTTLSVSLFKAGPHLFTFVPQDPAQGQIEQPEFDIPRPEKEMKTYAQILREYLAYLNRLGNLLGGDPIKVEEHASMSLSITSQLSQFLRQQRAQGKLFQMVTIDQLQEMAPAIDWLSCLQAMFTPISLSPSQLVVVHDLDYLQNMSQLVETQLLTHRDFLQSHMIFGLVGTLSPALDSKFQEARRVLNQKLRELTERPPMPTRPRWMTCMEQTRAVFESTLAAMFSREALSPSTQSAAMELFTAIRDALLTHLRSLPWMDEESRRKAQDRVTHLQAKMGAPEWAPEPVLARQEYNDIHLGPSYLQSFLSSVRSRQAKMVQSSLQPVPHHRWQMSPWEVSANYSISDHVVVFSAGLLQPPFFHPGYPRAVNFGAAGSIMAHKLLRIFDQLLLPGGCLACDSRALHGAQLCLERHYAAFPLPNGTAFNSSHSLQESAADVGGLAIALQAYSKGLLWHRGETTLPNLGLSPHQLFFLSYAQVMCGEPSTQESQDTHSPPVLRVHGPLSNTPAFARYFSCPSGTLMNPSHRCQLW